jgi:hypothetical protein
MSSDSYQLQRRRSDLRWAFFRYRWHSDICALDLDPGDFTYFCEEVADQDDFDWLIKALQREAWLRSLPRWLRFLFY